MKPSEVGFKKPIRTSVNKAKHGKSCLRFTNPKRIPYELIGELVTKITLEEWLQQYQHYQKKLLGGTTCY